MSEEQSKALDTARQVVASRRARGKEKEYEILLEDVEHLIPNKYLAVNVAARRARELNERELPVSEQAKLAKKPTTQALLELIEGCLVYDVIGLKPALPEIETDADSETDQDVEAIFEEFEEPEDLSIELDADDIEVEDA